MGRRELLIILAFVVVGVVAYQVTAPAPKEGERGFSFSRMWGNMRREMRGNAARATFVHKGSIPVTAEVTQIRLSNVRTIVIKGTAQRDITYELTVQSNAGDDAAAMETAKATTIKQDDLGSSLALRVVYPQGPQSGSQTAGITLTVPARLAVRIESGNSLQISGVASVDLAGFAGEASIEDTAQAVTGTHQRGQLTVNGAGTVSLTLTNSHAGFVGVRNGLTIVARNSTECTVGDSHGPISFDQTNAETKIVQHAGPIRIVGSGGSVTIERPQQEVRVDTRRTEVEVLLASAVPMTLLTASETLRLLLDGPPPVTLDAMVIDGNIQAGDFGLTAEVNAQEARLVHSFGSDHAPRVALRNQGANIVIRKSK